MTPTSRIRESTQSSNENRKNEDKKKQLACTENRKSTVELRGIDKITNKKDQMDSCLKLLKFITDSQLTLTQINGQRKLGPPPGWTGPPPGPKCEVFVGSIPRNYYEPDIVLIFSTVGRIYELRLMMDFSGTNRGYCFIMYTTEEEAVRAVKELDQYEIYPGKRIGVVASINNCRLHIKQLPQNLDSETIMMRIFEITDDVDKVAIYRNLSGLICYALISYKTHRGAAMGRRRLVPESTTLFKNCEISIEWANPNMTPSNVFEECGSCDEQGKIRMKKTFIESTREKPIVRPRHNRIVEKQFAVTNSQRAPKPIDSAIPKVRAIRAASGNLSKSPVQPPNRGALEKCQWQNLVCSQSSLMDFPRNNYKMKQDFSQAWDINGNLRNALNYSSLYGNLKKNQYCSILPPISMYLSKNRHQKNMKWNNTQKYSSEGFTRHSGSQIFRNSLSEMSYRPFHNRIVGYPYRMYGDASLQWKKFRSNDCCYSMHGLTTKFANALSIANKTDQNYLSYGRGNVYKNELHAPMENNVKDIRSFPNCQTVNDSNRQFANYYQNFGINGAKQRDVVPCLQFSDPISGQYNLQNIQEPLFRQEQSFNQFAQQSLQNNYKPMIMGQNFGWVVGPTSSRQALCCDNLKIPESLSDFKYSNDRRINDFQNIQEIMRYDNQINHGTFLNPVSNFDNRFVDQKSLNSVIYPKDLGFMDKKQEYRGNFQADGKCFIRPILKSVGPNIKVNY